MSVYDELKTAVFRSRRKDCSVLFSPIDEGRAFQTHAMMQQLYQKGALAEC